MSLLNRDYKKCGPSEMMVFSRAHFKYGSIIFKVISRYLKHIGH